MSLWPEIKSRLILTALAPVLVVGTAASLVRYLTTIAIDPKRGWRIALAVDDLGNVAGNGHLGQTISSRAAHAAIAGKTWGKLVCKGLDTLNPGHCANAILAEDQNLNVNDSTPPPTPKAPA
ncbi:MAG: hypothetical protein ACYDBH_01435 [Acidobacteriaceae bacterium]